MSLLVRTFFKNVIMCQDTVIGKALKIALRLHQDYISSEDFSDPCTYFSKSPITTTATLFDAIKAYEEDLVVCHESDPLWNQSIMRNTNQLLSLRKQLDPETQATNFVFMLLQLRYIKFRVQLSIVLVLKASASKSQPRKY